MTQRRNTPVPQIVGDPTSRKGSIDSLTFTVLGVLVAVTAVSPYMYGPFLAVPIAFVTILRLLRKQLPLAAILWTFALVTLGALATIHGLIRMNPGAVSTMTVYVVEPMLFGLFFGSAMARSGWEEPVTRSLDVALFAVTLVGVAVYVAPLRGLALPTWLVDPRWAYGDLNPGTIRTNYQGFNSLVFLAPYGLWRAFLDSSLKRRWRGALASAAFIAMIISGRKILYLSIPIALALTWMMNQRRSLRATHRPRKQSPLPWKTVGITVSVFAITVLSLSQVLGITPSDAIQRTVAQFTLGGATDPRADQGGYIIEAWANSPLFGYGSGATIPGYQRSAESPWNFELSYHTLLLNFGLFGLVIMLAWGAWILAGLRRGLKTVSSSALAGSLLCAFISTALAIYADPYVQKFDGMWMLFIPFGAAVYWWAPDHDSPNQGKGP